MGLEVLVGASLLATGASVIESNNARKDSKRANRASQRIEARKAQRQKQEQLRASQRTRAEMMASSVTQGTQGASASQGGVASVQTQTTNNISFIEQINQAQLQVQRRMEKAAQHQFNAQALGQVAGMASMATDLLPKES